MKDIFNKAIKEVREEQSLSLTTRKKIWETLGDRELNLSLKGGTVKRVKLALETVKKVVPEWEKAYPQDKRPHILLEMIQAHLDKRGKREEIEEYSKIFLNDLITLRDTECNQAAVCVGIAVCYVADILLADEPLMYEEELRNCISDEELDPDTWDYSYFAYLVYGAGDTVKEQEFWYWYVEKAASLIDEDVLFSEKKGFASNGDFPTVETLDDFVKIINEDFEYISHELEVCKNVEQLNINVYKCKNGAKCSTCGTFSSRLRKFYKSKGKYGNLSKRYPIVITVSNGIFYCDNENCNEEFFPAESKDIRKSIDSLKKYLSKEENIKKVYELLKIE